MNHVVVVMLRHVVCLHGFLKDIVSDRGSQFAFWFWKAFCSLLGATVSLTSGYQPQSNGQTESLNQELETGPSCLVSEKPATWSRDLIWVECAHNTLLCSASGLSPFQFAYSYQPPLFPVLEEEVSVPSAQALIRCCRRTWTGAHQVLSSARTKCIASGLAGPEES